MISSKEVITLIKGFSITERLMIVEEILRNIREENWARKVTEDSKEENSVPAILSLAGVIDAEEAGVLNSAVEESRKIDRDEWQLSTGFECRDRHFQRGFGDDSKSQEN